VAEDAERAVEELKKVEYMQQYLGDVFEGIITGITNFGMFVELDNTAQTHLQDIVAYTLLF
ncbi:MAG TPA: S1 RNA-binding domain-containing protein, partial [Clostridiaceae bacterium]|nr:S1 RNA-binding domain-containing protein [Clostridiaceae bacterium]